MNFDFIGLENFWFIYENGSGYFVLGWVIISFFIAGMLNYYFFHKGKSEELRQEVTQSEEPTLSFIFFAIIYFAGFFIIEGLESTFLTEKYYPGRTCYTYSDTKIEYYNTALNKITKKFGENWAKKIYKEDYDYYKEQLSFKKKPYLIILEYTPSGKDNFAYNFSKDKYELNKYPNLNDFKKITCGKVSTRKYSSLSNVFKGLD